MSKHQLEERRAISSFAGILTLCAVVGVSGTLAALALAGDDMPPATNRPTGPTSTVASGRLSNGMAYELSVTKTEDGICLSPKVGEETQPAMLCGPEISERTGDVNLAYTEVDGSVLITPLVSSRVESVSVSSVDDGGKTVEVAHGNPGSRVQARQVPGLGARVAVISLPLRSTGGDQAADGAPPSVSFTLTAFDEAGKVVAVEEPSARRATGPVDEPR
jgi:hypothetical protein